MNVKPQAAEAHNALAYDFDEVKPDSTVVTMSWDKVAVPFKVEVKVNDLVVASIHRQLYGMNQYYWEGWDDAASYLLKDKTDLDEALKYADRSTEAEQRFENLMTKADLLDALNRKNDALGARNQALSSSRCLMDRTTEGSALSNSMG